MPDKAIILFTRIPMEGKTKTRLQPFLNSAECAALQEAFLKDIYTVIKSTGYDLIVCYNPYGSFEQLKILFPGHILYMKQRGSCLGEKMHYAITDVLALGYDSCVLIGSDIPLIHQNDIDRAFDILKNQDIVLGPTEDGGYYLVGMKKPCKAIFSISYGSSTVFHNTCSAIESAKKTYGIGNSTLDIDVKEDLYQLIQYLINSIPSQSVHTKEILKEIMKWR